MIPIPKKTNWHGQPRDVDGAMERLLKENPSAPPQIQIPQVISPVPKLDGFVYVPAINLYVAKQRTLGGNNWYDAHKTLIGQGLRMPTIKEFAEFLKYLKTDYQNRQEAGAILEDILTVRDPWRSEWLDAKFEKKKKQTVMNYGHRLVNGNLEPQYTDKIDCLMTDKTPGINLDEWINDHDKYGLPKKSISDGQLYYWCPENGRVAGFGAGSDRAGLYCSGDPDYSYSSLGVFACAEGAVAKK